MFVTMLTSPEMLPMVMHASESGDTFLLKLMLYNHNLDAIFAYAMQATNPEDETPTDVIRQFIRVEMFSGIMPNTANQVSAEPKNQIAANLMPLVFLKSAQTEEEEEETLDQEGIDYIVNAVKMDNVVKNLKP